MNTPWGNSDHQKAYGTVDNGLAGIIFYGTPSHGGFRVPIEHQTKMPSLLRRFKPYAGAGWYEEDCDWAIVALAFPQLFNDVSLMHAVRTVTTEPDSYMAIPRGWLRTSEALPILKRVKQFETAHAAKFLARSCGTWGDGWTINATTIDGLINASFTFKGVPHLPEFFTRADVVLAGGRDITRITT